MNLIVVEDPDPVDLVRIEKSLHSVGFFASTPSKANSRTVVQTIRRTDGQRIQAKAVIEGIPSLGLPTTADRDKYMAFMKIALDQRDQQGQLTNPVRFSGADMIKLLRLRKGGFHYDEINDWCKRMVATTIMSESSIFLADRRQYASDTFHVFDRVVLVGEEMRDGSRSDFYQVFLSLWQLNNLNQGYLLPLDFNAYLQLSRDIAKALFGHLSVWFYASKGRPVEKKYQDLCQLLHIRAYPHPSKARAVLAPSLQELVDIGYLSSWELVRTTRGADFKLVLHPGKRLLSLPNFASVVDPDANAALRAALPSWVGELVRRGVAERKARQLALDVADDQNVLEQIEYAEYLIEQDKKGRGKLTNAPGFLVWAIEQNLQVPTTFDSAHRRRARELAEKDLAEDSTRRLRLEISYQQYCDEQVDHNFSAQYPQAVLENAIKDELRNLRREQPEWFSRAPEHALREVAISVLRKNLKERLNLPTFSEWERFPRNYTLF